MVTSSLIVSAPLSSDAPMDPVLIGDATVVIVIVVDLPVATVANDVRVTCNQTFAFGSSVVLTLGAPLLFVPVRITDHICSHHALIGFINCTIFSHSSRLLRPDTLTSHHVTFVDDTSHFGCISTYSFTTWLTYFGYDMWCPTPDATHSKLERGRGVGTPSESTQHRPRPRIVYCTM